MFGAAFIQEKGGGRLPPKSELVRDHRARIGLPVRLCTPKRIDRRRPPSTLQSLMFGDVDCMHGAMRQ